MLVIDLIEKISLLATAALAAVLFPPLRNRLLGLGRPRDRLAACLFGIFLCMWGAKLGDDWLGYRINVRNIGVMLAGILGGPRAGAIAGLLGGGFYALRVNPGVGLDHVAMSVADGLLAGLLVDRRPRAFQRARALPASFGVQIAGMGALGLSRAFVGEGSAFVTALPAIGLELLVNSAAITFFVFVAHVILSREENAVALAAARAAADSLALESLRRRLEPHFLFNALNALRATIRTDPMGARELVADLADLYRYLLHHPDDAPLSSEVSHACAYLGIERARLGSARLNVRTEVDPEVADARVPALLLQPLVENAVKHGIAPRAGGGDVILRAHADGPSLVVEVEDRGSGEVLGPPEHGAGIALETLRLQLAHRFGEAASLTLSKGEAGTTATVSLPISWTSPSVAT